jgi:hypothetical protein
MDIAWLLIMVTGWLIVAYLLIATPDTADRFWHWSSGLALWQRVIEWIVLLPWMLALAIWESDWSTNLRVGAIIAIAAAWIVAALPGVGP